MISNITRSTPSSVATIGFVLLFPGFFVYHLMVSAGIIPSFLGGFFSPVALLLVGIMLLLAPLWLSRIPAFSGWYIGTVFLYFLYIFFWAWGWHVLSPESYTGAALHQTLLTLLLWCALFFVGYNLDFQSRNLKLICELFIALAFLYLAYYYFTTGSVMFFARAHFEAGDARVASYQGFARSAMVASLLVLAIVRTYIPRCALIVSSLFILFMLGARSELFGYAFAVCIYVLLFSFQNGRKLIEGALIAFVLLSVVLMNIDVVSKSRHAEIINLDSSSSASARADLMDDALAAIFESPIQGAFGAHLTSGEAGSHSHNALSAWSNYGLVGFLGFVFLVLVPFLHSLFFVLRRGEMNNAWVFVFLLSAAVMLLIVAAKSIFWPVPALLWGVYAQSVGKNIRDRDCLN